MQLGVLNRIRRALVPFRPTWYSRINTPAGGRVKDYKAQTISPMGITPRAEIFKAGMEKRRSVPGHPRRDLALAAAGLASVVTVAMLSNGLSGYLERQHALTDDPQWTQQVMPSGVALLEAAAVDGKVGPQLFEKTLNTAVAAGTDLDAPRYGPTHQQTLLQVTLNSDKGNRFAKAHALLKVAAIHHVRMNGIEQAVSLALAPSLPEDVGDGRRDRIRHNASVFANAAVNLAITQGWSLDGHLPVTPTGETLLQQASTQQAYRLVHQIKTAMAAPQDSMPRP